MFKSLFSPGTRDVVSVRTKIVAGSGAQRSLQSIVDAINRVQGVIEFDLEGRILNANPLFLDLMGYSLGEVQGRHHSMFVVPGEENSDEYRDFWRRLREGLPDSRVYQRVGKGGRQVWIQASYNPILDSSGRPIKVVKFASDLTELINQTDQTRKTAESVAAATEELSYSIAEIGQNLDSSRSATNKISAITQDSGSLASNLLDSMKSMERIVGLIRGIASQVNMLALNATIEAARAGDAGKGFAVVASEVKNLSDQTAKATDQIGREIGEVQEISAQVAQSIKDTVVGVEQVNEYVSTVATAIQEQGSVTREIASHSTQMVSAVDLIMAKTRSRR